MPEYIGEIVILILSIIGGSMALQLYMVMKPFKDPVLRSMARFRLFILAGFSWLGIGVIVDFLDFKIEWLWHRPQRIVVFMLILIFGLVSNLVVFYRSYGSR